MLRHKETGLYKSLIEHPDSRCSGFSQFSWASTVFPALSQAFMKRLGFFICSWLCVSLPQGFARFYGFLPSFDPQVVGRPKFFDMVLGMEPGIGEQRLKLR